MTCSGSALPRRVPGATSSDQPSAARGTRSEVALRVPACGGGEVAVRTRRTRRRSAFRSFGLRISAPPPLPPPPPPSSVPSSQLCLLLRPPLRLLAPTMSESPPAWVALKRPHCAVAMARRSGGSIYWKHGQRWRVSYRAPWARMGYVQLGWINWDRGANLDGAHLMRYCACLRIVVSPLTTTRQGRRRVSTMNPQVSSVRRLYSSRGWVSSVLGEAERVARRQRQRVLSCAGERAGSGNISHTRAQDKAGKASLSAPLPDPHRRLSRFRDGSKLAGLENRAAEL